jgi:hypothetical protein
MIAASLRRPALLVKPSFIFLVLFTLQVQLSSAINLSNHLSEMANPWIYFLCIHGFGLVALIPALFFNNKIADLIFGELGNFVKLKNIKQVFYFMLGFLIVEYIVLLSYLHWIPFNRTGLYAILFDIEMLDSYRESSMKLLENDVLRYSYILMEKTIAPIAASLYTLFFTLLLMNKRNIIFALLSIVLLLLIIFPALVYGARGPAAMVLLVVFYTFFLIFVRRLNFVYIVASIFGVLVIPVAILVVKNHVYTIDAIFFQSLNALDRSIGRSYIDNVWHYQHVEKYGTHGILAIEKFANLMGAQPVDPSNVVAINNKDSGKSFGFSLFELSAPIATSPKDEGSSVGKKASSTSERSIGQALKCDPNLRSGCIDVSLTGTSTASFVMMNYSIFGWLGLFISIAFVFAIDGLLYAFTWIRGFMLVPAAGAIIVPILGLSFSMMTTTLASRGLLIIPLLCFIASKLTRDVDNNSNN